jgi:hypothetical protein
VRVAVCVLLAGCGRIAFDSVNDAAPAAPTFSAPNAIAELSAGAGTDDPTLTQDQREIYFATYRNASIHEQVWHATRATVDSAWDAPTLAAELDDNTNNGSPELSFDGLTLYVSKTATGNGDIYEATRPTLGAAFGMPILISGDVNTNAQEFSGTPSADGLEFFYHVTAQTDGTGLGELWVATRATTSSVWSNAHRIDELADGYDARNPFPTADGLVLYFSSASPLGDPTSAKKQIFRATRATRTAPWNPALPVESLRDVTSDLQDPWLPADQSRIYFSNGTALLSASAI